MPTVYQLLLYLLQNPCPAMTVTVVYHQDESITAGWSQILCTCTRPCISTHHRFFVFNFSVQYFSHVYFHGLPYTQKYFLAWKFLTRNFQHKFFINYGMFTKHVLVEKCETYLSLKTCQQLLLERAWASYTPLVSWLSFHVCVSVCVVHSGTCSNS